MIRGSNWRDHSWEVIAAVTKEQGVGDPDALEKAIRAAYPFGERAHWPYKVWLSEVKKHMQIVRDLKGVGLPKETGPLFQKELFQ